MWPEFQDFGGQPRPDIDNDCAVILVKVFTFRVFIRRLQKYVEFERRQNLARNFPPCGGVGLKVWNSIAQICV